ncbi:MAG: RES family NAD+ phosphorylase [Elusimicrobia bacterium]|nr:RES family NAD+ phosphorylase [Elusimicrobiota bacterium]
MIRAWRIDKAARSKADSFSGEGGRLVAGRWNSKGQAVVYAASTLSLAALEKFVHLGAEGSAIAFVSYEILIPSTVRTAEVKRAAVPGDWREQPAPASTQKIGDEWIRGMRSAVLRVPSVVTPDEFNLILNPAHPDFVKIKVSAPRAYSFDSRMWK